jgi:transporter family-2 protein
MPAMSQPNPHLSSLFTILLAVAVGVATSYQSGINAKMAQFTPTRLHGGLINFLGGFLVMLVVVALSRSDLPNQSKLAQAPWWAWTGGLLGAFFVTMALVLVPKIGAANLAVGIIAGQLLGSLIIDHFGHMGLPPHPITTGRLAGVVLIAVGVACVRWL